MGGVMGWLDANDYFLIAAMATERIDELQSSTEIAVERAAIADQRSATLPAHFCAARGCVLCPLTV